MKPLKNRGFDKKGSVLIIYTLKKQSKYHYFYICWHYINLLKKLWQKLN